MIQRYIQQDYKRIIEIWQLSVKSSAYNLSSEDYNKNLDNLENYLRGLDVYVYRKSGKIMAFMGIDNNKIEILHCDPEYKNQDINVFMVKHAVDLLNVRYIDIHESDKADIELYHSLGFETAAYYPHDELGYTIVHLKLEKR